MKRIVIILIASSFILSAGGYVFSEENEPHDLKELQLTPPQDPFEKSKSELDWLISFTVDWKPIGTDNGAFIGVGGAVKITESLFLGIRGLTLVNPVYAYQKINGVYPTVGIGYGGLWFGYRFFPNRLIGFTVSTVIGAGGLNYGYRDENQDIDGGQITGKFAISPEVSLDFNFSDFFGISLTGKYLFFSGNESYLGITPSELSGFSAGVNINFSAF